MNRSAQFFALFFEKNSIFSCFNPELQFKYNYYKILLKDTFYKAFILSKDLSMSTHNRYATCYILEVTGKQGLTFKTKKNNTDYLEAIAQYLLQSPNSNYTDYKIRQGTQANSEITQR